MAQENVQKFMDKFAADKSLQELLQGKKADEVVAAAAEMGYDFTKEELGDFVKGIAALSPEQLEQAAGGNSFDELVGAVSRGVEKMEEGAAATFTLVSAVITGWFK